LWIQIPVSSPGCCMNKIPSLSSISAEMSVTSVVSVQQGSWRTTRSRGVETRRWMMGSKRGWIFPRGCMMLGIISSSASQWHSPRQCSRGRCWSMGIVELRSKILKGGQVGKRSEACCQDAWVGAKRGQLGFGPLWGCPGMRGRSPRGTD
jgi:hypothetical protein